MNIDLQALAVAAGDGWGGFETDPVLITHRENAVFRAQLSDARPVALRLHRDGYQSDAAIGEELQICEMLADAGFACPWPYRTDAGGFVHLLPDGQTRASIVQWIDATPLSDVPLSARSVPERYEAIGAVLADLHLSADTILPRPTARPHWNMECLTGTDGIWGDWASGPGLSDAERDSIAQARARARGRLFDIPANQTGLIHGDALPDNILDQDRSLFLIDFDDCGIGFRLYDLATALISSYGAGTLDEAAEALKRGYLYGDGPLPEPAFADLPLFVMLRAHASAAWAMSRCKDGDPRRDSYRSRALDLTASVLNAR